MRRWIVVQFRERASFWLGILICLLSAAALIYQLLILNTLVILMAIAVLFVSEGEKKREQERWQRALAEERTRSFKQSADPSMIASYEHRMRKLQEEQHS